MIRKWDKNLAWWLELANLCEAPTADPVADGLEGEALMHYLRSRPFKEPEAPSGFAAGMRRLRLSNHRPLGLDRLLVRSPVGADRSAYRLAQTARAVLAWLAARADLPGELREAPMLIHDEATSGALLLLDVLNGRISLERPDPLSSLCVLLNDANAHLVGQCPVCDRLFERLRKDQKCDTRRCRDIHRKRQWRIHGERYERNRPINRRARQAREARTKRRKHGGEIQ